MKSLSGKIFACFLLFMIGFNLAAPIAGAVGECADHPCCCRSDMTMAHHEPASVIISDENRCCSSAAGTPCKLNNSSVSDSSVFITSSARETVQDKTGQVVFASTAIPFHHAFSVTIKTNRFRIIPDPIPIYLQNNILIC